MELSMKAYRAVVDLTSAQIAEKLQTVGTLKGKRICSRQSVDGWIADDPQVVFVEYHIRSNKVKRVFRRVITEIWGEEA